MLQPWACMVLAGQAPQTEAQPPSAATPGMTGAARSTQTSSRPGRPGLPATACDATAWYRRYVGPSASARLPTVTKEQPDAANYLAARSAKAASVYGAVPVMPAIPRSPKRNLDMARLAAEPAACAGKAFPHNAPGFGECPCLWAAQEWWEAQVGRRTRRLLAGVVLALFAISIARCASLFDCRGFASLGRAAECGHKMSCSADGIVTAL